MLLDPLLCGAVAPHRPEHGLRGALDEKVVDSRDEQTGLPVYSLYGERTRPAEAQLEGLDTLVYDIQDVGARFYTYISTLGLCMEAAAAKGRSASALRGQRGDHARWRCSPVTRTAPADA